MNNNFSSGGALPPEAEKILKENNIDPKNIDSKNAQKILSNLNKSDAEKINNLLNNKDELNRLLNSKQAKLIMQQLFGGNKAK